MANRELTPQLKALLEQAKSEKRADKVWKPQKFDFIAGVIRRMKPVKGNNDNTYICLTIEDSDGELWIVNAGQTIMEEIELKGVAVGGTIVIYDHGTVKVAKGAMRVQTCAYEPSAGGSRKPG